MHLSPKETDRLLLFLSAELARRRRARGVRLNYPEARALIADELCEGARDGKRVGELMSLGASILTEDDVMPGVAKLVGSMRRPTPSALRAASLRTHVVMSVSSSVPRARSPGWSATSP